MKKSLLFSVFISLFNFAFAQEFIDENALRYLWNNLDGPNWKYPSNVTESQKWFNKVNTVPGSGEEWYGLDLYLDQQKNNVSVAGIYLEGFMVPKSGNCHFANFSKFANLQNLSIRNCPQIQRFESDSLIQYVPRSIRQLEFSNNKNAIGLLPDAFFPNFDMLTSIRLNDNKLTGNFPCAALGKAKFLVNVEARNNMFSGSFSTDALVMGGENLLMESRSIDLSSNAFVDIKDLGGFSGYSWTLNLSNNKISDDGGFLTQVYRNTSNKYSLTLNLRYNKLANNLIFTDLWDYQVGSGSYFTSRNGFGESAEILPQILGDTTLIDVYDVSRDLIVNTHVVAKESKLGYWINNVPLEQVAIESTINSNGEVVLYVNAELIKKYLTKVGDKIELRPYFKMDPFESPLLDWNQYQVKMAPIYIRKYDLPLFDLKTINPIICNLPEVPKVLLHNYKLEVEGFEEGDKGLVQFSYDVFKGGMVVKNGSFEVVIDERIVAEKQFIGNLDFSGGDSVNLKIKDVALQKVNGEKGFILKSNISKSIVGVPRSREIIYSKFFCKTSTNRGAYAKIVNPQPGVSYFLDNVPFYTTTNGDTLTLNVSSEHDPGAKGLQLDVYAKIDGSECQNFIGSSLLGVVTYTSIFNTSISTIAPTCSSDAIIDIKFAEKGYWYHPGINYGGMLKSYGGFGADAGLSLKIPVYEFNGSTSVNNLQIYKVHDYCGIASQAFLNEIDFSFKNDLNVVASDSNEIIRFVKSTGFNPTKDAPTWYQRDVLLGFDKNNLPVFKPIRDWSYSSIESRLFNITCGRITSIDFGSGYVKGDTISRNNEFKFDFGVLSQLRSLDISYNDFMGKIDFPQNLNFHPLKYLDVSYNGFSDTSFTNMGKALKNTDIKAQFNKLSFMSIFKARSIGGNNVLVPQKPISFSNTVKVFEGKPVYYKNPIPETYDPEIVYQWYNIVDTQTVVCSTKDLIFPKAIQSMTGIYLCKMMHPAFVLRSEITSVGQNNQFYPQVIVKDLKLEVLNCGASAGINAGNDASICNNASLALNGSILNGGEPKTVLWKSKRGGGFVPNNSSFNGIQYQPNIAAGKDTLVMEVTTDGGNCLYRDSLVVTINALPILSSTLSPNAICSGDVFNYSPTIIPSLGKYKWVRKAIAGVLDTITTGDGLPINEKIVHKESNVLSVNYVFTLSANGCENNQTVTVPVKPIPRLESIANKTYCADESIPQILLKSDQGGSVHLWSNSNTQIGLPANGEGDVPSFVTNNNGSSPLLAQINITSTYNGCVGVKSSFTITINPIPKINPVNNRSICSGKEMPSIEFKSNLSSASFSWINDNPVIGLQGFGDGNIPAFIGKADVTQEMAVVNVKVVSNNCIGPVTTFSIFINPTPKDPTVPDAEPVCEGQMTTLNKLNTPFGTYFWCFQNASGPVFPNPYNAGALKNTTVFYLMDSVETTGCKSMRIPYAAIVNINPPEPIGQRIPSVCLGDSVQLIASGNGSFYWYTSKVGGIPIANKTVFKPLYDETVFYLIDSNVTTRCKSSRVPISVKAMPLPLVSLGVKNKICVGESIALAPTTGGVWMGVSKIASVSSNGEVLALDSGVVNFSFKDEYGCVNTTADLIINPLPAILPEGDLSICMGKDLKLSSNNGSLWYSSDAEKISISTSGVIKALQEGDSYVSVANTETNCVSKVKTVSSLNLPKAPEAPNLQPICKGSSVVLEKLGQGNYVWYDPLSPNRQIKNGTESRSIFDDSYYLLADSSLSNGCVSEKIPVRISLVVPPSIEFQPDSFTTCNTGKASFAVNAVGSQLKYRWYFNDVLLSDGIYSNGITQITGSDSSVLLVENPTQGVFDKARFKVKIEDGCLQNVMSESGKLTVKDLVNLHLKITADKDSICFGDPVLISSNLNNGVNPVFEWYLNGDLFDTDSNRVVLPQIKSTDSVWARVTVPPSTCLLSNVVFSNKLTVFSNELIPDLIIETSDIHICDSAEVVLRARAIPNSADIQWFNLAPTNVLVGAGDTLNLGKVYGSGAYFPVANYRHCKSRFDPIVNVLVDSSIKVDLGLDVTICPKIQKMVLPKHENYSWEVLKGSGTLLYDIQDKVYAYQVSEDDLGRDTIMVSASVKLGVCPKIADSVNYVFGATNEVYAGDEAVNPLDSIAFCGFLKKNMANQNVLLPNNPQTWYGVKTSCGYITDIRLPNMQIVGNFSGFDHGALQKLRNLDMSHNKIDTLDFMGLADKSELRTIKFAYNHIGTVKNSDLATLNKLDSLNLGYNYINEVFSRLKMPRKIVYLNLANNRLQGELDLNDTLSELEYLDLSHNHIVGVSNTSKLKYCNNLNYFDLGNNWMFAKNKINVDFSGLSKLGYFAVDSNSVGNSEDSSGVTSLPILPQNNGLRLSLHANHLQFDDLLPYKDLILKNEGSYSPQYPYFGVEYDIKPQIASIFDLQSAMAMPNLQYEWGKYHLGRFEGFGTPDSKFESYSKVFEVTDTGTYSVRVTHPDLVDLVLVRRPIVVSACEFSYFTRFGIVNANNCKNADTLKINVRYIDGTPLSGPTYTWYFGGNKILEKDNVPMPVLASGRYRYSVLDIKSKCYITSTDTLVLAKLELEPNLVYLQDDSMIKLVSNLNSSDSIQWMINGMPIAGANRSALKVYYNGTYSALVKTSENCVYTSKGIKVTSLDKTFLREEHYFNQFGQIVFVNNRDVSIYPIPARDVLTLEGLPVGMEVSLWDIDGKKICEKKSDGTKMSLDVKDYSKGLYLLKMSIQRAIRWEKVILE